MAAMTNNLATRIIVLAASLACVFLAPAQEHTEQAAMKFFFDPEGSYMIAATHSNCYIAKITRDERDHVHTNQGMEDLEIRMLHDWLGKLNETRVYHTDTGLTKNIRHWCANQDIYVLARTITDEPTPTSPIHLTT